MTDLRVNSIVRNHLVIHWAVQEILRKKERDHGGPDDLQFITSSILSSVVQVDTHPQFLYQ